MLLWQLIAPRLEGIRTREMVDDYGQPLGYLDVVEAGGDGGNQHVEVANASPSCGATWMGQT